MAEWVEIMTEANFKDHLHVYEYNSEHIAIFKLEDGFYAINNRCSHEEAYLSEGEIENGAIECPLHGAVFDIRTGRNLSLPAVLPVRTYPVKVENGVIYIQLDS
jgi:nitrite reductase/ring-hydroxylating ferredoxin subunit